MASGEMITGEEQRILQSAEDTLRTIEARVAAHLANSSTLRRASLERTVGPRAYHIGIAAANLGEVVAIIESVGEIERSSMRERHGPPESLGVILQRAAQQQE